MRKIVSILGCGWLGFPLARYLIQEGFSVKGSTTSPHKIGEMALAKIQPYLFTTLDDNIPADFFECDILVLAFPPKSKTTDGHWYVESVRRMLHCAESRNVPKVVMLSATSVYPDSTLTFDEETGLDEKTCGSPSLLKAERLVLDISKQNIVARLGGLAGEGRLLARHFAGRENIPNGDWPVNLIHLCDAVGIVGRFVGADFGGVFNVCAPRHPTREELYTHDCRRFGLPIPQFVGSSLGGKVVAIEKLLSHTSYRFKYPDPFDFEYTLRSCGNILLE